MAVVATTSKISGEIQSALADRRIYGGIGHIRRASKYSTVRVQVCPLVDSNIIYKALNERYSKSFFINPSISIGVRHIINNFFLKKCLLSLPLLPIE